VSISVMKQAGAALKQAIAVEAKLKEKNCG
jgi:hypothetical protein